MKLDCGIASSAQAVTPTAPAVPYLTQQAVSKVLDLFIPASNSKATSSDENIPRALNPLFSPSTSDALTAPPADTGLPPPAYPDFNAMLADHPKKRWEENGTILILSRHGVSLFNRFNLVNGANNSPLLAEGEQQARELAATLSALRIAHIYTSPLERASRSAEILQASLPYPVPLTVEPGLLEMERGVMAGRPKKMSAAEATAWVAKLDDPAFRENLRLQFNLTPEQMDIVANECKKSLAAFQRAAAAEGLSEDEYAQKVTACENTLDCEPPQGESFRQGQDRARRLAAEVEAGFGNGAYLMEGHGMSVRLLLLELLNVDMESLEQLYAIPQDYCGATVLWRPEDSAEWQLLVLNGKRDGS